METVGVPALSTGQKASSEQSRNAKSVPDMLSAALDVSKAPAITRAAAILRLLGDSEVPLGVNNIARELNIISSTCLHILRGLVSAELVAFNPRTKLYTLDIGLLTLSRNWLAYDQFNELIQPELDHIARTFHVSAIAVEVVRLEHVAVVAVSRPTSDLQLTFTIGSRLPILQGSIGRCIAAFGGHSDAELQARLNTGEWDTPPISENWKGHVPQTRKLGMAIETGHYAAGITTIAAPIWNSRDELSHVLSVASLQSQKGEALSELQTTVSDAARLVSSQLRLGLE